MRVVSTEFTCTIKLCRKGMCWIGCVECVVKALCFVSKKQSVARKMWMTDCAQTKCGQSGCVVARRMTIEMRVRNRECVETVVVNTECPQSSCVGKRGCREFSCSRALEFIVEDACFYRRNKTCASIQCNVKRILEQEYW